MFKFFAATQSDAYGYELQFCADVHVHAYTHEDPGASGSPLVPCAYAVEIRVETETPGELVRTECGRGESFEYVDYVTKADDVDLVCRTAKALALEALDELADAGFAPVGLELNSAALWNLVSEGMHETR